MHGTIFSALRGFPETEFGSGTWAAVLQRATLGDRVSFHVQDYPDAEAMALVPAASSLSIAAPLLGGACSINSCALLFVGGHTSHHIYV